MFQVLNCAMTLICVTVFTFWTPLNLQSDLGQHPITQTSIVLPRTRLLETWQQNNFAPTENDDVCVCTIKQS
jgi:hypothetical protein